MYPSSVMVAAITTDPLALEAAPEPSGSTRVSRNRAIASSGTATGAGEAAVLAPALPAVTRCCTACSACSAGTRSHISRAALPWSNVRNRSTPHPKSPGLSFRAGPGGLDRDLALNRNIASARLPSQHRYAHERRIGTGSGCKATRLQQFHHCRPSPTAPDTGKVDAPKMVQQ
jgi:hypothetical protein